MNTTNGKIAERSKQKFAKALLAVMNQYDFKEITITQLSQEAGLSRKTFYRLFKGKDDLRDFLFENLYKECLAQIESQRLHHYWDVVQCYFDFCEERKELLSLLKRNHLLAPLFEGSYKYSLMMLDEPNSSPVNA